MHQSATNSYASGSQAARLHQAVREFEPRLSATGAFPSVNEAGDLRQARRDSETIGPVAMGPSTLGSANKGRLLVVDDEELILSAVTRVLRRIGYVVAGHSDPVSALSQFEADPAGFDAVITDFRMPEMTGLQLSERLVSAKPGVPILLVSGHTAEIDGELARQIGIDRVVSKPLSTADFESWLDQAMPKGGGGASA